MQKSHFFYPLFPLEAQQKPEPTSVPPINLKIEPDTQRLLGRKEMHLKTPWGGGCEWVSDMLSQKSNHTMRSRRQGMKLGPEEYDGAKNGREKTAFGQIKGGWKKVGG